MRHVTCPPVHLRADHQLRVRLNTDLLSPSYDGRILCGMPRGNLPPKLAIMVDSDVHAQVLEAASEAGISVSAWMTKAARRALRVREGLVGVVEWEAEHGVLTDAELAEGRHRIAEELLARTRQSA